MSNSYISVAPIADSTPGFSFGRSGTSSEGAYLLVDSVPSNLAGRIIPFSEATLTSVFVVCQIDSTFTIEVQKRAGILFTTVYTATLTSQRIFTETGIADVEFTQGEEICVKIGSGTTSNVIVGLIIKGNPL